MFTPLPEGTYTLFPKAQLDRAIANMERRPVAAGYLADGDVITSDMDATRYSWLV
ncbi:hypothetical protein [Corynebacterium lactis]|uniref:Uncharacterized protein n=1 Tax=Corynebacterium lactis RW2-5 TaxID=1408189 RepID=A0A0K2H4E0_9CORY|nr:hypothetical protein [Corynebacterium lactis]ALA68581.1 hypothetical protein CLAC_07760 [Corynebacterium lactis RW2-5]